MSTEVMKPEDNVNAIAISTFSIGNKEVNSVSARELHEKLETVTRFDVWIKSVQPKLPQ